jgi:alkanesulfonate monooxygenase SsuD/methylene tetrahydromethanopterin reductase-like flavin-dependent oxidoreductase (luciferase family)
VALEFGFFAQAHIPAAETVDDPDWEHRRLLENLEYAVACEANGVKYVWCPEHHFLEEYSHMPAPEVFLSFVAARTTTLHVGSAIINTTPPVNHPARTAERVAVLDHLSEGRFEFGTGRGSSSTEILGFDIDSVDTTKDMWDETIGEFVRMWREDAYAYEGRYFRMPERNVLPKPWSRPHPPIWVACGSPPTFEKAGRLGLGAFCFTTGTPDQLQPLVASYKDAVAACTDPVGAFVNDNILGVSFMLCMEDRDEAFRLAAEARVNYYVALLYRWLDNIVMPPGMPAWPKVPPAGTPADMEAMTAAGLHMVGDPDDCARVCAMYEEIGIDQIVLSPLTSTLPYDVALHSLGVFGREVVPRFDTDPVHRSTRMRERALAPEA